MKKNSNNLVSIIVLLIFLLFCIFPAFIFAGLGMAAEPPQQSLTELRNQVYSLKRLDETEKQKLHKELLKYINEDKIEIEQVLETLVKLKDENWDILMNIFKLHYDELDNVPALLQELKGDNQSHYKPGALVIKEGENVVIKDASRNIDGNIIVQKGAQLKNFPENHGSILTWEWDAVMQKRLK